MVNDAPRTSALPCFLLAALVFALSACGEKSAPKETTEGPPESHRQESLPKKGRKLTEEATALLKKADKLRREGRYREARALYARVLKEHPGNMKARRGAALKDVTAEQWREAIELMKKARNETFLGHPLKSWRLIKKAAELDPNNEEIATLKGSGALLAARHHEAARIFKSLYRSNPDHIEALLGWIEATFATEDYRQCLEALEDLPVIEKAAQTRPRVDAHLAEILFIKGVAASSLYRYEEAIDALNLATRRSPKKARYRNALAGAHLEAGHFELALSHLEEVEKLAPDTSLLYYRKGKALERLGRMKEAAEAYREELRRDRRAWRVAVDCARAYEALGGRDNLLLALSFLEQALTVNPRSHEARYTEKAIYRKLGNIEESRRINHIYQTLIEFKSAREKELRAWKARIDANPRDFEAWLGTINVRSRFNPIEDVLREVHKLLNIEPNHPDGLWHLINLLLVQNKLQRAWLKAMLMVDTHPNDSRGHALAATALYRLGRLPEAEDMARQGFHLNRRNGAALEILVLCLQSSDPEGAELKELMPLYRTMKAEEQEAIRRMKAQEDQLNRKLSDGN